MVSDAERMDIDNDMYSLLCDFFYTHVEDPDADPNFSHTSDDARYLTNQLLTLLDDAGYIISIKPVSIGERLASVKQYLVDNPGLKERMRDYLGNRGEFAHEHEEPDKPSED